MSFVCDFSVQLIVKHLFSNAFISPSIESFALNQLDRVSLSFSSPLLESSPDQKDKDKIKNNDNNLPDDQKNEGGAEEEEDDDDGGIDGVEIDLDGTEITFPPSLSSSPESFPSPIHGDGFVFGIRDPDGGDDVQHQDVPSGLRDSQFLSRHLFLYFNLLRQRPSLLSLFVSLLFIPFQHQIIKSSNHQIIKSSNHQIIKSSNHQKIDVRLTLFSDLCL